MSTAPGIFGPIVTDTRVENEVLTVIRGWLPSYLDDAARQDGFGEIARPRSYETIRDAPTKWNEQALPAIVCQVGGTVTVTRRGQFYTAVYGLVVGAVVGGQSRANTRQLAGIYSAALATLLAQHGDLDGFADGILWQDTDYDLIEEERTRTLMAALVTFDVTVNQVLDVFAGPSGATPDPDDDPIPGLPPYGEAATAETDVLIVPITEPLP